MENSVKPFEGKTVFQRIRSFVWSRKIYFLVFALPALIMYVAYAFFGVHPYGDNSVLVLDLNGQYVYYYEAFRDFVRGGNELFYNWSRNLSGEMFGIFAYYLASPFMLLICFLPRTWMCGAIELLQILKIGTAAFTFAVFLRKTSTPRNTSLVVFGTCYGLMSYMVVQLMDPMWLDGLIYLPLICLGIHRLVDKGRILPFAVPLALMFISHFYIGYMVGIFTFFYFLYYCFTKKGSVFPPHFLQTVLKFALGTLISLMCAAFVLIPVYNSLKLGKLEFSVPDFSLATQFDFASVLTKLFPMSYDSVNVDGMPMIYCGTITILLVPLFFMNTKIHAKKKAGLGILAALLLICMYIRPVDMVWHGLQMPNWLPFRYSFALSFLLLIMAYEAFENLNGITTKEIGGVFFGILVYLIWCERENYSHFQIFETNSGSNGETYGVVQGIWLGAIAVAVCFLLVCLFKKYRTSKTLCVITCILVCLELTVNTMDTLDKIDHEVCYSSYSSYEPYMSNTRDAVQKLKQSDSEPFYRMEATFHRTVNDPIGVGYYGISHSSSTMNAPVLTMLKQLGFSYGGHSTKYQGETYITDALFDIKYIMDKEDDNGENQYENRYLKSNETESVLPKEYKKVAEIPENGATYKFYENPYALGLGMTASAQINNVRLGDENPFENQNTVFNALLPQKQPVQYFTRIQPYGTDSENLETATLQDGYKKLYQKDKEVSECHVDYLVEMDKDSILYMYLPSQYERACNIWVQNEKDYAKGDTQMQYAGQFFEGDNYAIMNLGEYKKGDRIRVRITIANDENEAFWTDTLFYSFDKQSFENTALELQKNSWNITSFEGDSVEGTVTAYNDDQLLFTTIPAQDGWKITVNGKQVETGTALNSLITVPLEKGENTVKMIFSPDYFKVSVVITVFGLLMLFVTFVLEYKNGVIVKKALKSLSKKSRNSMVGEVENESFKGLTDCDKTSDEN